MSFQAYLDTVEKNTGITPLRFVELARERGYDDPKTTAGVIFAWLAEDYGIGRGHAQALAHVIRNGAQISDKHVGTTGVHRDASTTLELGGIALRQAG